MRWQGRRQSENVEDRRGMSIPIVGGGLGAIVLALVIALLGGDPSVVFQNSGPASAPSGRVATQQSAEDRELREFVGVVLADTEDVWHKDREDIDEALHAASAIGDDRLQMQAQGYVVPDAFTHGTSEQRVRWFQRGWETGDLRAGDSFNATQL